MQKFDYRNPRFQVSFPVRFTVQDSTVNGHCIELGEEGMRLELHQSILSKGCGTVSISWDERTLDFPVRVVHALGRSIGVEFVYESPFERSAVAQLVAWVSAPQRQQAPVLLTKS